MKKIFNVKKLIKMLSLTALLFAFVCQGNVVYAADNSCGDNATYILENNTLTIEGSGKMTDFGDTLDIPWFDSRDLIEKVVISDGITNVGGAAFYGCSNLLTVQIPSSVKEIGDYAFSNCEKLTAVVLPQKLETIGANAFENCTALSSITIPDKTKSIGSSAFYRCENITAVTIPKSVKSMGPSIFAYCYNLLKVDFKCSIDKLPVWTFYGCTSLKEVTFSSDVDTVGEYAYFGCNNLSTVSYKGRDQDVDEIKENSKSEGTLETAPSTGTPSTGTPSTGTPSATDKNVETNKGSITTTTQSGGNTTVDIVINNDKGNKETADRLEDITGGDTTVNIQLKGENVVDKDILESVAGKDIDFNVTSTNGSRWNINCDTIGETQVVDMNLSFTIVPKTQFTEAETAFFGDVKCYDLTFESPFYYDAAVKLPLSVQYAREYATLYILVNGEYKNLGSVLIDNDGRADFAFGAGSVAEGYVIAVNVPNQNVVQDAYIPENMMGEYTGLMDEYGTRYVVTGTKSSLGIGIGEFTRYVVVGMIAIVIVVGAVVAVISRQKFIKETYKNNTPKQQ